MDESHAPNPDSWLMSPKRITSNMTSDLRITKAVLAHRPHIATFGKKGDLWEKVSSDVNDGLLGEMPSKSVQARCKVLLKNLAKDIKQGSTEERLQLQQNITSINSLIATQEQQDQEAKQVQVKSVEKTKAFLSAGLQRVKERREATHQEEQEVDAAEEPDAKKKPMTKIGSLQT